MTASPRIIEMPPAIRGWLAGVVERGGWQDAASAIAAIPTVMQAGRVVRLVGGGPYGRMLDGRLDEVGGRIALEVLENSRMSGEEYFRVWDDGTVEPLEPAPRLGWSYGPGATEEEKEAAHAAYAEHNRRAYDLLRERGFIS